MCREISRDRLPLPRGSGNPVTARRLRGVCLRGGLLAASYSDSTNYKYARMPQTWLEIYATAELQTPNGDRRGLAYMTDSVADRRVWMWWGRAVHTLAQ